MRHDESSTPELALSFARAVTISLASVDPAEPFSPQAVNFEDVVAGQSPTVEYRDLEKGGELKAVWDLADGYLDAASEGQPDVDGFSLNHARQLLDIWSQGMVSGNPQSMLTLLKGS